MPNRLVLEICVESVDHAIAAERGGAHRIELCTDLPSGGTTPSAGLMQIARRHVKVPIHVLIRPRAGDFCYSGYEFETMREDVRAAKETGMNGIVLGILRENMRVDVERTKMLVEFAHPLPVTFHRAFDLAKNHAIALEEVIKTGASRILTSGGKARASDALPTLARLTHAVRNRLLIIPCGGINSANIVRILQSTSVREIHTSVGASHPRSSGNGDGRGDRARADRSSLQSAAFEKKVMKLVECLSNFPG
jgi:copper homeostasis protein